MNAIFNRAVARSDCLIDTEHWSTEVGGGTAVPAPCLQQFALTLSLLLMAVIAVLIFVACAVVQ